MPRVASAWIRFALLGAVLGLAACAEMRANERPPMNPFFSPGNQAGNRA